MQCGTSGTWVEVKEAGVSHQDRHDMGQVAEEGADTQGPGVEMRGRDFILNKRRSCARAYRGWTDQTKLKQH